MTKGAEVFLKIRQKNRGIYEKISVCVDIDG